MITRFGTKIDPAHSRLKMSVEFLDRAMMYSKRTKEHKRLMALSDQCFENALTAEWIADHPLVKD